MIILGIETSCDETSAAVVQKSNNRITILSNIIASSAKLQDKYGGVIPEQAAREQIKAIIPVIQESLQESGCRVQDIDATAVTEGPGLIGSLLVGVETAKTLSLVWDKPLIPVNHLLGHFWANWIVNEKGDAEERSKASTAAKLLRSEDAPEIPARQDPEFTIPPFPCLGILVSGGHTDLVLFKNENKYEYLGGTRDDAAGECFDKCARLLGLSYPGGPEISRLATKGDSSKYKLPRPMIDSDDFDFSFSGLKTSVSGIVDRISDLRNEQSFSANKRLPITDKQDLAASIEQAIIDVLVKKVVKAAQNYNIEQVMVAGGVGANKKLSETLRAKYTGKIFIPPPYLCTDNGAMIAARAFFEKPLKNPLSLQANPNLSL